MLRRRTSTAPEAVEWVLKASTTKDYSPNRTGCVKVAAGEQRRQILEDRHVQFVTGGLGASLAAVVELHERLVRKAKVGREGDDDGLRGTSGVGIGRHNVAVLRRSDVPLLT